jgi:ATPase subunit of ABC transporter with duplicated ATPase domains
MEKRMERMRTTEKPTKRRKMEARFASTEFRGDEVLVLRNVAKSFGDKHLFDGISLKIEGGERIALIGDNGTGKSTLMKMIVGELEYRRGPGQTGPLREAGLPASDHVLCPPGVEYGGEHDGRQAGPFGPERPQPPGGL